MNGQLHIGPRPRQVALFALIDLYHLLWFLHRWARAVAGSGYELRHPPRRRYVYANDPRRRPRR